MISIFRRIVPPGPVFLFMFSVTAVSATTLTVDPWPRDGWFRSQDRLFALLPGEDNYAPITVPAVFYKCVHWLASGLGLDLRAEFYLASLAQNLLVFLSACFVYYACRAIKLERAAAPTAIIFLVYCLCLGLPQAMWSENSALVLFAAALYLSLSIYAEPAAPESEFWLRSAACGFLIGLLVVTRIVPIFMIPASALLLWKRLDRQRLAGHLVLASVISLVMVVLLMLSNQVRFGRLEITNSSGRHLWQGVTTFVNTALEDSPRFQQLRSLDPEIQGKDWWDVKLPEGTSKSEREAILGGLAREAIRREPLLYLQVGLVKFATTIFKPLHRLGFGEKQKDRYDPLLSDKLLPALGSMNGPALKQLTTQLSSLSARLFTASKVFYPVPVLLVMLTCLEILQRAMVRLPAVDPRRDGHRGVRRRWLVLHLILGLVVLPLVYRTVHIGIWGLLTAAMCCALLLVHHWRLSKHIVSDLREDRQMPALDGRVFMFLGLMFFVSLWFSWQVEARNTRNVVPYLPFLAVMTAAASTNWARAAKAMRLRVQNT